jgi:hypothetical protein
MRRQGEEGKRRVAEGARKDEDELRKGGGGEGGGREG